VAQRRLSFRGSTIAFALMTVTIVVAAMALLILLDPRAQAYWGSRLSDLGTAVRQLLQR